MPAGDPISDADEAYLGRLLIDGIVTRIDNGANPFQAVADAFGVWINILEILLRGWSPI